MNKHESVIVTLGSIELLSLADMHDPEIIKDMLATIEEAIDLLQLYGDALIEISNGPSNVDCWNMASKALTQTTVEGE